MQNIKCRLNRINKKRKGKKFLDKKKKKYKINCDQTTINYRIESKFQKS